MKTFLAGLGLLPLALVSGQPGRAIEGSTAIVLRGPIRSAVLSLLVLPDVASCFGRFGTHERLA